MTLDIIFYFLGTSLFLFLIFWKFWFLRDPERKIPNGNTITSPADGKIIQIIDLEKTSELKIKKGLIGKIKTTCSNIDKSCYLISIFMNLTNVHVQRTSLSGKILNIKHESGQFKPLMSFENGLVNEKTEILIKNTKIGNFKIIQIAGFLARRIETWLKVGQKINKGDKIGRINLGSQVSIILPKNKIKLMVKKGDKVHAGSSVIAKIRK